MQMFGIEELKVRIEITKKNVECPVRGCTETVARQRGHFRRLQRFKCREHNIFISPSTFEYARVLDNLLWKEQADLVLLNEIRKVKRESRIARDNSEDAVTWNVFRFLERNDLVAQVLGSIIGTELHLPEIIWWSYSQKEKTSWSHLNKARLEFGEPIERGSEPDLIVLSRNALFFIEAKFGATNKTVPSQMNSSNQYETGGNSWFSKVFQSDYRSIAIEAKKYELMRFWLLGTWIADKLGLDFYLVNLVLAATEKNIEAVFKPHIRENEQRKFIRITWENIYQELIDAAPPIPDKEVLLRYFRNKSLGYREGRLRKAFSID